MNATDFNPFTDRFSRDLRNELSEGFAQAVENGTLEPLQQTLNHYKKQALSGCYSSYLNHREKSYRQALEQLQNSGSQPMVRARILWNLGLFFELHEVLEHAWYSATGVERACLQAMIRAAGVYIKRESGYQLAAEKIAGKALPVLTAHQEYFAPFFSVTPLLAALSEKNAPAPQLPEPENH